MVPSSHAVRFKMSIAVVWLLGFCAALGLGFTLLIVGWLVTSWSTLKAQEIGTGLFSILMLGGGGYYCYNVLRRGLVQTAVDETGIWRLPRKGSPILIAWPDVSVVKADDTGQCLIVSDHIHTFRLEYQIDNFANLRNYILENTSSESRANSSGDSIFHRTLINKIIFIFISSFGLTTAAWFILNNQVFGGIIFLGLSALVLFSITQDPLSLTIESEQVVIRYPGWKRTISFGDINSATLAYESTAKGNTWAVVVLDLKNQKPVKLYRFREGSLALTEALQSALDSNPT